MWPRAADTNSATKQDPADEQDDAAERAHGIRGERMSLRMRVNR